MLKFIKLVCFLCLFHDVLCNFDESQFTHRTFLDDDESYQLFWKYDENEATITIGAQVKTTGYIGLGFSPNGGMVDSDIFTVWVSGGKVYGQDRYSVAKSLPPVDISQDFEIISGEENDTHTTVVFKRKIRSCDSEDRSITVGAARVIWAFGQDDPDGNDENKLLYHGINRGTKTMYLLDEPNENIELPEDTQTWDLLNDKVAVTDDEDTTYWCHAFKVPDFGGEKHIIKWEPVVQEGHEKLVHHILIYECYDEIPDSMDNFNSKCYEPELGLLRNCVTAFVSWALGGEEFYYPENVGYPLGLENSPGFVMMEVHYDNPTFAQKPGYVDSSGIRLHYTSQLREHRAGLFLIGSYVDISQVIPPGKSSFVVDGICSQKCLEKNIPDDVEELTLFAATLHSHLAGEAIRTRHFRNDHELEPILHDDAYDFNLQQMRPLNRKVKKGDSIITQCTYLTEDRMEVTYGGLSTMEEMCLSFILYYPRIDLMTCQSRPSITSILERMTGATGFELTSVDKDFYVSQPEEYQNQTYKSILSDIDWTNDENGKKLEEVYLKEQYNPICLEDRPIDSYSPWKRLEGPFEIHEEWVDVEPTCETTANKATLAGINPRLLAFLALAITALLSFY